METLAAESVLSRPRFAAIAFATLVALTATAFGTTRPARPPRHIYVQPAAQVQHVHHTLPTMRRCHGAHR
jgi:hypothetical protein